MCSEDWVCEQEINMSQEPEIFINDLEKLWWVWSGHYNIEIKVMYRNNNDSEKENIIRILKKKIWYKYDMKNYMIGKSKLW